MPPTTNSTAHKKRKTKHEATPTDIDTTRPSATYTPTGPRAHTLSIALPSSLIHNSKHNVILRTCLAGQIARALAVFSVDEIVVFSDGDDTNNNDTVPKPDPKSSKLTCFTHPGHFLCHVLSYLECPPFLRQRLFPIHENLERAGQLPSLDLPGHLRGDEWCEFREGVSVGVVDGGGGGTFVDCGLGERRVVRGVEVPENTRVTVRLGKEENWEGEEAEVVGPDVPRVEGGYYWGYQVREARGLSAVFTECQFDGGYDLSIGTSERGEEVGGVLETILEEEGRRVWKHLLVVFGGVKGLEVAAENDTELVKMGIGKGNVRDLFDYWVNLLPGQGSRTIRTEEAVWMGLMATRRLIDQR